ncbi:AMP phosphorylase [Candidatus Lokiarchaeum ossiferum]|uniref:AMP phosphorylase n=1 Tax=Candidatus Lokiarchaeum ossiferum TaxID=2951803 RepID=UPI00352DBB4D
MKFKFRKLGISSGAVKIIVLDDEDAFELGAKPGDRVRLIPYKSDGTKLEPGIIAVVDIATGEKMLSRGTMGLYDEVYEKLKLSNDYKGIDVQLSSKPNSFLAIKAKVKGKELSTQEIQDIINDCTHERLLDIEKASFIIGLEVRGATDREVVDLTNAMAHSGEVLDFGSEVYDKHSTGGVPGNKVTLIIVPIIAAAGLFIPKTSTRAITSPSGTADSFEVLAPVAFSKEKVLEILKTEKCGILWGGALDSAPADNALIRIEKPLTMDPFPLMIASIICKKMSMGVKKLVLDIPCGKGTKFPTLEDGKKYAIRFKDIAQKVGIQTVCLLTNASQPIGHAVGPALEAREAMNLLINPLEGPSSLRNKSCELAGILLEMAGKAQEGQGKDLALEILNSGQAYTAMKRMIKAQGGNPDISPENIEVGPFVAEMKASFDGFITSVENEHINRIAKIAGCPAAKKAGIEILRKIGQNTEKGEVIFKIYSDSEHRLKKAVEYYNAHLPQILGGMTLEKI